MTFLAINALAEAPEATRRALIATFRDKNLPPEHKISRVKTIYNSLDIPEITLGIINSHLDQARRLVGELSLDKDEAAPLHDMINLLAGRNK